MMNYSDLMRMNEGLILAAFAFDLCAQFSCSLLFALLAILMAVTTHSVQVLARRKTILLLTLIGELIFVHRLGMSAWFGVLVVLNTCCGFLWADSSFKAIREPASAIRACALCFLVLVLLIPEKYLGLYGGLEMLVLRIVLMFGPYLFLGLSIRRFSDRLCRTIIKTMSGGAHDRLAGKQIYQKQYRYQR